MRRSRWTLGIGLLLMTAMMTGCDSKMKKENEMLASENQNLREQLQDRNAALDAASADLRDKSTQLADLQRQMNSGGTVVAVGTEFDSIPGVTGSMSAGEVTASVESDVLFAPGKATLRPQAKSSLDAVADVLNSSYAANTIRIGGHTDSDPIKKSGHKSNYHLGFERAYVVREYLLSKGVASERIYVASYGPDRPIGQKEQNRRVEIAVLLN